MPVLSLRGDPLGGIAAGDGGGVDPRRPPPTWACCPVMHSLHPGFCCHIQHIYAMITELWPPVIQALHSNISTLVSGAHPQVARSRDQRAHRHAWGLALRLKGDVGRVTQAGMPA